MVQLVDPAHIVVVSTHIKCYVLDSYDPVRWASVDDAYEQIVVFSHAQAIEHYLAWGSVPTSGHLWHKV